MINFIYKITSKLERLYFQLKEKYFHDNSINRMELRSEYSYKFSKQIMHYIIKNPNAIIKLKSGMAKKDIELIDRILRRIEYIYTHNYLDQEFIRSKEDLLLSVKIENFIRKNKKKIKFINYFDEPSIFYNKYGLIYIPLDIQNKLKNKCIIDGGAFKGETSIMFQFFFHPKQIYAFEPDKTNYNMLKKLITKTHNHDIIIPVDKALDEKSGEVLLKSGGVASYISKKEGSYKVNTITIDEFVKEKNLNVGLIKLDVEGNALKVIQGAKNTISKFKPILLIAIYHNGEEFFELKDYIKNIIEDYNIKIRKISPRAFADTTLIAY
ncbi:MAG: FkbM family methyltransferase [Promethearchaeota archaeon]